jgi:hypothetical protein
MKDVVFWDMTPRGSSKKNRCFRGTYLFRLQGILKMEAICSFEMSILLTRAIRRHIPEDNPLHVLVDIDTGRIYAIFAVKCVHQEVGNFAPNISVQFLLNVKCRLIYCGVSKRGIESAVPIKFIDNFPLISIIIIWFCM